MLGNIFYFDLIRKHIIYFGTVFNDISITRTNNDGNTVAIVKVPISYSSKDKMLQRIEQDPTIQRQTAILLPRMAFELKTMSYDSDRKLDTKKKISVQVPDAPDHMKWIYNLVPYIFHFQLSVIVKNREDGNKIIEQILPFFTPDWTGKVNLVPEMGISMNIPIILDVINPVEDDFGGANLAGRQRLVWTLDFAMKGYLVGPVRENGVITFANVNFFVPNANNTIPDIIGNTSFILDRVTTQPGLTANGQPTSNASLTIDRNLIKATDDFGYVTDIYGYINHDEPIV